MATATGSGVLEREGARIAYDWDFPEAPAPAARLVVLVNGYQRPRLDYRAFKRRLRTVAPELALVALDNRGVGESSGGLSGLTIQVMAEDALAVARKLIAESGRVSLPVAFLGISMGGMISQLAAATAPELVDKLVLVSTTAGGPLRTWGDGTKGLRADLVFKGGEEDLDAKKRGLERYFGREFLRESPLFIDAMAKNMLRSRAHAAGESSADPDAGARAQFDAGAGFDASAILPRLRQEVLIITGDDDRVIPPANAMDLKQSLRGAELQVYEGKGHLLLVEAPERLTADVARFLSKTP